MSALSRPRSRRLNPYVPPVPGDAVGVWFSSVPDSVSFPSRSPRIVFVVVVGHAENQPYGRVFQHCSRCLSDDLPVGPVEIVPAAHRIGVRREEIR